MFTFGLCAFCLTAEQAGAMHMFGVLGLLNVTTIHLDYIISICTDAGTCILRIQHGVCWYPWRSEAGFCGCSKLPLGRHMHCQFCWGVVLSSMPSSNWQVLLSQPACVCDVSHKLANAVVLLALLTQSDALVWDGYATGTSELTWLLPK